MCLFGQSIVFAQARQFAQQHPQDSAAQHQHARKQQQQLPQRRLLLVEEEAANSDLQLKPNNHLAQGTS